MVHTAPQLTVVTTKREDYINHIFHVASDVRMRFAKSEEVNALEIINNFVDPTKNNSELEKVFVEASLMTKSEFKAALKNKAKNDKILETLGYLPTTVAEFVKGFVAKHELKVLLTGELKRAWCITIADQVVTDEDREDPDVNKAYLIRSNRAYNTETMKLDLRVIRDTLGLPYSDSQIQDAAYDWYLRGQDERRVCIFEDLTYKRGIATGPIGAAAWTQMEDAAFDVSETSPGFAIAVIKKFMWQVKRKGMGLPVTNHIMPVITGPQGTGKSTLVSAMTQFMADCVKQATFSDIADNRLIDLWSTPILFMDEMSGAKKADMTTVKHVITATTLTRRPMRSNTDVQVTQSSTLIGCSNDSLNEIIRDNTGVRRFAELTFKHHPDRDVLNNLDWKMMWQSVDEFGEDPSIDHMSVLHKQQADNRNIDPVEMWARENCNEVRYKDWAKVSILHEDFSQWERVRFPGYNTSVSTFGKRMKNLMMQHSDLGWVQTSKSGYSWIKAE